MHVSHKEKMLTSCNLCVLSVSVRSLLDRLGTSQLPVISLNMPLMAWECTAAIDDEVTCCACAVPDPLVSGVLNPPLIGIGPFHDLCAR
jgi:hypothetical protein